MAVSEKGQRLNIRKATLRSWRQQFAENLRELGVAANATERAVRGQSQARKSDGIYRAAQRGDSTHMWSRTREFRREISEGSRKTEPGAMKLQRTRREVIEGWKQVAALLRAHGAHEIADRIRVFVGSMSPPLTERAWYAERFRESTRTSRAESPEKNPPSREI
jgi:hypothetical protein